MPTQYLHDKSIDLKYIVIISKTSFLVAVFFKLLQQIAFSIKRIKTTKWAFRPISIYLSNCMLNNFDSAILFITLFTFDKLISFDKSKIHILIVSFHNKISLFLILLQLLNNQEISMSLQLYSHNKKSNTP